MKQSRKQYAPWITDPDEPEPIMSPQEIKAFAKNVARFMKENPSPKGGGKEEKG